MTRRVLPVILAMSVLGPSTALESGLQAPAPYQLSSVVDGELTSKYSPELRSTVVQLSLAPAGLGGSTAAMMVFVARVAGDEPGTPPVDVDVVVIPVVTGSPTVLRNVQMEMTLESAGRSSVTLSYFGRPWGDVGYVAPGGEITRVGFTLSVAELRAIGASDRVGGHVMNYAFALSAEQLAALRRFARAIGLAGVRP